MPASKASSANAALRVLEWIERHIKDGKLGIGDNLPSELEIGEAAKASRSSVREALTALKVLGIIHTRRKGGITIIRDPVVLELRHFFVERYEADELFADVMEFRAAMEWGFGPLVMANIKPMSVKRLRDIVETFAAKPSDRALMDAEIRFHTELAKACGNRLSSIFAHLYPPIFLSRIEGAEALNQAEFERWSQEHMGMTKALETKNSAKFLELLRKHTHIYMRWPDGTGA